MRLIIAVIMAAALIVGTCRIGLAIEDGDSGTVSYQSPYGVKLPWPMEELIPDLLAIQD